MSEQTRPNEKLRFTFTKSIYKRNQSIQLTRGKYSIAPGDSLLMYIEGKAKTRGVGEAGVVELQFTERAMIYVSLPPEIYEETYSVKFASICEILNNPIYHVRENIFTCQSGKVVVDSIRGTDIFGTLTGEYLNTSNKKLSIEAPFKSKLKK